MKKLIILLVILTLNSCTKIELNVRGKIISHNVTSNRTGDATYRTIIMCNDNMIREKIGLSYYSIPIGDSVTIKETYYK